MTAHRSWRRVHFQSNALLKKAKTHGQMYKKQSTNFIILSLQRHEPLYPQNISLGKKKTKRKIAFRRPVHQQAQRKRFQSNGTRDTDNIENKDGIKHCGKIKWYNGQTRRDAGGCTCKRRGDTAVRFVLKLKSFRWGDTSEPTDEADSSMVQ